jgi:isoquinoline 1-oxidoreductase subunit beta
MPGVCHVVAVGDNAVAVVAQTWWQAKRALEALPITWDESPGALLTTELLLQHFREGLEHRTLQLAAPTVISRPLWQTLSL